MNETLNEIIQDLADLSYTALEKINKIHQVLIFNQDKLIELTKGEKWILNI